MRMGRGLGLLRGGGGGGLGLVLGTKHKRRRNGGGERGRGTEGRGGGRGACGGREEGKGGVPNETLTPECCKKTPYLAKYGMDCIYQMG